MANCAQCGRKLPPFSFGKKICQWCVEYEAAKRGEVTEDSFQRVMPTPWTGTGSGRTITQILAGINVGRGKSVVTNDLLVALKTGRIAGAGLDVVDPEPLPKVHPLWHAPNVVITPHVAGRSELKLDDAWLVIRENLRRYVAGDKLYSVVDVSRGY